MTDHDRAAWLAEDATDRRVALSAATELATSGPHRVPWTAASGNWLKDWLSLADDAYTWLRNRDSLIPARLVITPGIPQSGTLEGAAMTTPTPGTLSITDTQSDSLVVSAVDAAGFSTPDAGPFTWVLASGGAAVASVTDNGDGTATIKAVAPGSDTVNAADAGGLTGSLLVTVETGPANSLVITPGTPA